MLTSPSPSPAERLAHASTRLAGRLGGGSAGLATLGDEELLAVLADATEARKALELIVAGASAEVARRSTRDLGYDGLAQRKGARTGTALVQQITGLGRADVARAVEAGEELADEPRDASVGGFGEPEHRAAASDAPEWLALLRDALSSGRISQAQFHALRSGLGEPPIDRYPDLAPDFLPHAWARAVRMLLEDVATLPVEELRHQARIARDRLDPVGVTLRFEERFAARSFRRWTDESGQRHAHILFDDEAGAWVDALLQAALRPRRGPRFVGPDAVEKKRAAESDERTNGQLQYDTIMAVLRTGAGANPEQAFGDRQPGVRILVEAVAITEATSRSEMQVTGVGHVEDGGEALPGGVIEARLCDAGAIAVMGDSEGRPLDVGRELRLFSRRQRIAIAARDGGCRWPSCTAPISQCEFHHIDHWWDDHGRTDVDDGIALCRNCHLRLHNQRWRISRERDPATGRDAYWLHPPPDPATGDLGERVALRSKSPRRFEVA